MRRNKIKKFKFIGLAFPNPDAVIKKMCLNGWLYSEMPFIKSRHYGWREEDGIRCATYLRWFIGTEEELIKKLSEYTGRTEQDIKIVLDWMKPQIGRLLIRDLD